VRVVGMAISQTALLGVRHPWGRPSAFIIIIIVHYQSESNHAPTSYQIANEEVLILTNNFVCTVHVFGFGQPIHANLN